LISYARGHITVLDRPGLEKRTCECYAVVKREYDRLLAPKVGDVLMGAAVMDLDAVRRVTPALSQNALNRVDRVKETLEQAIDLKRRVIEELRPSILDNFGLFAALRWQLQKTWGNSDVVSTENYPDVEPQFEPHIATALFRIAQEALSIALKRTSVKSTDLTVCADHVKFWMRFSDDGVPNDEMQTADPAMILASIRHRIRTLGGDVQISLRFDHALAFASGGHKKPSVVTYE
jgi:signal transduction histidine kinase